MSRGLLFLVLALVFSIPLAAEPGDDGPPISITSPDKGTTFAFGTIKSHALIWNKNTKVLIARITFTDDHQDFTPTSDDTHDFRLFGINFDPAKGIFTATTAKGEVIPVAHFKRTLFIKSIETTPNAAVRVLHPKGNVTVILEAISPDDPAMQQTPDDPDSTHKVDINQIVQ